MCLPYEKSRGKRTVEAKAKEKRGANRLCNLLPRYVRRAKRAADADSK